MIADIVAAEMECAANRMLQRKGQSHVFPASSTNKSHDSKVILTSTCKTLKLSVIYVI